jgi:XTP/dITP diphosphohydrolase
VTVELVLATRNAHKVEELQRILAGSDLRILGLDSFPDAPEVPETGVTFAENAILKARHAALGSGLPALADDSGLEVDALDGAPGVYSARYAGEAADDEANRQRLIAELARVPLATRTGRFRCAIAVALPDGAVEAVEGRCEGVLITEPRGSEGFGYDPLFLLPERGLTMAELPLAEKNVISHRGRATVLVLPVLRRMLGAVAEAKVEGR